MTTYDMEHEYKLVCAERDRLRASLKRIEKAADEVDTLRSLKLIIAEEVHGPQVDEPFRAPRCESTWDTYNCRLWKGHNGPHQHGNHEWDG